MVNARGIMRSENNTGHIKNLASCSLLMGRLFLQMHSTVLCSLLGTSTNLKPHEQMCNHSR